MRIRASQMIDERVPENKYGKKSLIEEDELKRRTWKATGLYKSRFYKLKL